jgi:protein kinase C substrate 80K-H
MKVAHVVAVAFGAASHVIASADSPRPRGVSPECKHNPLLEHTCAVRKANHDIIVGKHYKSESFKCINYPDVVLGNSQVNDDYCDCPDGSDEPGTAACSHLNDTLVLPGYYCKNKGK